ncbi:hypothetical protein [Paenibacillus sp. Root444D2]|uniref:hypothetical protein n=1 Tax=Paenibacillus sp. Root444D2 TaxID=1736538 RepID=UPI00070F8AB1|nr:hypothetical protein [Paenibacillus sp. Root444D2]KQX46997.1 hypothetical protein ASD40_17170 [Paenibacillus sp. Root444D2]
MGKEKKAYSKKEKIVGAIASTAILAVPFMVAPAQQGYANIVTSSNPPTPVEKITTIVIPLNGTKYIDLDSLYSSKYMYFEQNENEMNVAKGEILEGSEGILEIKAGEVGKATFTVKGTRYVPSYTQIIDTFQVIVVPNTENADQYKFDISKVVKLMNEAPADLFDTADKVKGLLINVDPETLLSVNPFNNDLVNSAPYQIEATSKIQGTVGEIIESGEIQERINNYFNDDDIEDNLKVFFINANNENIQIEARSEGEIIYGYNLIPLHAGDFDLDVLVVDHNGGVTKGKIPFHIAEVNSPPDIKINSVLAQHFLSELNNPILKLSQDAEIDLNDIFFDVDEDEIHYEVTVEQFGSPDNSTSTINLGSASKLSWEYLNTIVQGSILRIKNIHAFNYDHPNDKTELNVNIEHASYDPFPSSLDMYKSNAAGTSSYIFDYQSELGFGEESRAWIGPNDILNNDINAVTASVYQNVYLKFDAKDYTSSSLSKIKIYAHDQVDSSVLYQDDFNFRVISVEDTRNPQTQIPAISPRPLYPYQNYDSNYWAGSFHFRDFVSVIPEQYNDVSSWTFETGSTVTMSLTENVPSGTHVLFKIDPEQGNDDSGKRVFYVPYVKP